MANGSRPAATAAPGPDDEPPDHRSKFHGFRVAPEEARAGSELCSAPNSWRANFARRIAPAASSCLTIAASPENWAGSWIFEPFIVGRRPC